MRKLLILFLGLFLTLSLSGQIRSGVVASRPAGSTSNPQNLFLYSEQIDNAAWAPSTMTVNEGINGANDLTGGATLDLIRGYYAGGASISQTITVIASTEYKLSFDYIRGTWGDADWNVFDLTHSTPLVNVTSYYASTSGSVQRVVLTFSTTSGTISISVRPNINTPGIGNCYIGRVQLCTTVRYSQGYVVTTSSIVP